MSRSSTVTAHRRFGARPSWGALRDAAAALYLLAASRQPQTPWTRRTTRSGGGHGLIGMRERATPLGGTHKTLQEGWMDLAHKRTGLGVDRRVSL
ncbi:MAG TPA: hypothetical protein VFA46_21400 [Actinomycetes bacterium]|nr:hypothetical protein [Actinomycetes bacterium]